MKEFIKQNWFKLGILIILIIVVFGSFYFYYVRPSKIKQRCYAEAEFDKKNIFDFDEVKRRESINNYYQDCLKRFGVK